jgi:hypothetical protein
MSKENLEKLLYNINSKLGNGKFWSANEIDYITDRLTNKPLQSLPELFNYTFIKPIERCIRQKNVTYLFFNTKNNKTYFYIPEDAKEDERHLEFVIFRMCDSDKLDANPTEDLILLQLNHIHKNETIGQPNFTTLNITIFSPKKICDSNKISTDIDSLDKLINWRYVDWENNSQVYDFINAEGMIINSDTNPDKLSGKVILKVTYASGKFDGKKDMAINFAEDGSRTIVLF